MKRSVRYLVLSIIAALSAIIISIPFWNFARSTSVGLFSQEYNNLPIVTRVGNFESLVIIDDDMVNSIINPTEIVLKNRNGYKKDTNLYLLVEKRSTIPYQYIRVSVNDQVYRINEIEVEEDENNYYFYIKNYELNAYEELSLNARIWLSQETNGIESTSTLVANFVVR